MKKAFINLIEYYLPEAVLTNEELAKIYPSWTAEKIMEKTGIFERRISEKNETSLDMAEKACKKIFDSGIVNKEKVDFLILLTETPDYILPPSSSVLHGRLGLNESCGALDINLGCSAYIYGLAVSKGLISAGIAKNILLVTAEEYSKLINPMDKSTRSLFGDAATASVISTSGEIEICDFDLGSRGKEFDKLIVPAGMFRMPKNETTSIVSTDENGYSRSQENVFMSGQDIMAFSIDVVPKSIKKLLEENHLGKEEIDYFIFHQANAFMLSYLKKKIKIEESKFEQSFSDVGNTVSSSVPLALKRSMDGGRFPQKGNVVLCGFGVGLSWGSVLLKVGE